MSPRATSRGSDVAQALNLSPKHPIRPGTKTAGSVLAARFWKKRGNAEDQEDQTEPAADELAAEGEERSGDGLHVDAQNGAAELAGDEPDVATERDEAEPGLDGAEEADAATVRDEAEPTPRDAQELAAQALAAAEQADLKKRQPVTLTVSLTDGSPLAELQMKLGNTVREVGQALIRQKAIPILPKLFHDGKLLRYGPGLEASDTLLAAGLPQGVAGVTAELCTAIVTASKDCTAKIWNADTGLLEFSLEGHSDCVQAASFSPDCRSVVSASADATAKLWRLDDGKCKKTLVGHKAGVHSASFSPDSKLVTTASEDGTGKIWLVKTGDCLKTLRGHGCPILWASFAPDGLHVTTTGRDGQLKIWNSKTGTCDRTMAGQEPVYCVSFASDGRSFVTQASGDSVARICDVESGECTCMLVGHEDLVLSASFAPALRGEEG